MTSNRWYFASLVLLLLFLLVGQYGAKQHSLVIIGIGGLLGLGSLVAYILSAFNGKGR
jgi:hypothetical protein